MADAQTTKPSSLGELALWVLAGLFLSAAAITAVAGAKYLFGWSESQWILASAAVGVFSITWGSWAALLWTHSRVLKALMVVVTALPGVLMVFVGAWAFFNVPDNPWMWRTGWIVVAGHGVGALAIVVLLAGRRVLAQTHRTTRARRLAIGWTLYPFLVVLGGVAIVAISFALLPDLFCGDTSSAAMARWVVPSQALVLATTVLPAGAAQICRFVTRSRS